MSGTAIQAKAIKIRFPRDTGRTDNDFGVRKYDVTTSHSATVLPTEFAGRQVVMLFIATSGDTCHFAFSVRSAAEVSTATAATAAGATAKVGWPLQHGIEVHRTAPDWNKQQSGYLVIEGSAAGTLYLALADG